MNKILRTLFVLTILSFVLLVLPVLASAAGDAEVTITTNNTTILQGDSAQLNIEFYNGTDFGVNMTSYRINGGMLTILPSAPQYDLYPAASHSFSTNYPIQFGGNDEKEVYVEVNFNKMMSTLVQTATSNTLTFQKAGANTDTSVEFEVTPDTTSIDSGDDVHYEIYVKNNGSVGYNDFSILLNGTEIKNYNLLPVGGDRTYVSTQQYMMDKTAIFGYEFEYTAMGVPGRVKEIDVIQYDISVDRPTTDVNPTNSPSPENTQSNTAEIDRQIDISVRASKNNVKKGDTIEINIVVENRGNIVLKDVELFGIGNDTSQTWAKIAPQEKRQFTETVVINKDMTYIFGVNAVDFNGNAIEVKSTPIDVTILSKDDDPKSTSVSYDSNEVDDTSELDGIPQKLLSPRVILIAVIAIILIVGLIAVILVSVSKKNSKGNDNTE